jgi:hypothetical protein
LAGGLFLGMADVVHFQGKFGRRCVKIRRISEDGLDKEADDVKGKKGTNKAKRKSETK